jgi:hypothetical protein
MTPARAAILAHACDRVTLPRVPAFFRPCRRVEIGDAYRMGDRAPWVGSYVPDAYTGQRGTVVRVCDDGDLEIELDNGRGVFVYHARVRPIGPDGMPRLCPDEIGGAL